MKRHSTGFIVLLAAFVILFALGIALLWLGVSTGQRTDLRFIMRETAFMPAAGAVLRI